MFWKYELEVVVDELDIWDEEKERNQVRHLSSEFAQLDRGLHSSLL